VDSNPSGVTSVGTGIPSGESDWPQLDVDEACKNIAAVTARRPIADRLDVRTMGVTLRRAPLVNYALLAPRNV
jgi:hypothetical protein